MTVERGLLEAGAEIEQGIIPDHDGTVLQVVGQGANAGPVARGQRQRQLLPLVRQLPRELAREAFGTRFPFHVVSAEQGTGIPELRKAIYDRLGVMRVYTKQPGKPADMTSPFTCPVGSTVAEFAGHVHKDFEEGLKSARVWGSGAFDGQTVGRDHVVRDKDVVELHL